MTLLPVRFANRKTSRDTRMESSLTAAPPNGPPRLCKTYSRLLPPRVSALRKEEVHVWRAPLVQEASRLEEFRRLLSEDERARAARFHFRKDHEHFVVARGLLRTILGWY